MVTFEKSVGGVIFRREDSKIEYLLLHYPSGHWDFPKGHVENGETEQETLKREIAEETGISDLKIISGFRTQIKYFYRAKNQEMEKRKESGKSINIFKKVVYYIAETRTKSVEISFEHLGYAWLDSEQSLERITYKNGKDVLRKADDFLRKNPN